MQLRLSAEDAAFQQRMREFFTTQVPKEVIEANTSGGKGSDLAPELVRLSMKTLNAAGLAVPNWPVEWGGQDWTTLQKHIWASEMELAGVPSPLAFNAKMIGPVIAAFGSQELKERFLAPTANLDIWWCQGFSEPNAGSDLAGLKTTAVRDGDNYVINGQKTWTTLGQFADWMFILVRTDPNAPKKQMGISMLLLDMKTPGVTVRPIKLMDGQHEVNEVFFDNVVVPANQLVGEENKGWTYAKFLLGNERAGVAPVGAIKLHLSRAKDYAAQVQTETGTLLDDPLIAARIAELEAAVMALELTVLRVAGTSKDGKPDPASSILKLRGSEIQQDVIELVMDIAGPASLTWPAVEGTSQADWTAGTTPTYLNFRKATIYGGSSEVQRSIIASANLGLKG
ncbi:acyl-CoA dehydrogenase family protein [Kribbia dieselivorans]|uniref:acyl-CoA dehydrogenase family protein n=1 Tax=Kribbia dieselivorans TaxID=331526 RepID=UPI00083989AA|nr:acyl-CoA dehydrogenase family protein [Kribbia dieselivorans]